MTSETDNAAIDASTRQISQKRCACYPNTDARTCYDLRYYGYSPVMRGPNVDHSEAEWLTASADDDKCACSCHEDDDEDW